jgi:hypothetical protein
MSISLARYLIAQYVWLLVLAIPFLSLIDVTEPQLTKDFFSASNPTGFNASIDPAWFLHVSEFQLNAQDPSSYSNVSDRMSAALSILHPQKVFISGGIVANTDAEPYFTHRSQHSDDWALYDRLMSNLSIPSDDLYVVAGDTDIFGIASYDSPSNHARAILGNSTAFDFQVRDFTASDQAFRVVLLNPYRFPTATFGLVKWAFPTIELRRRIYAELLKPDGVTTIVLSHHPASMWNPTYDTTKENAMPNILIASANTRFFLSGHINHENYPAFLHHGNVLEAVAAPLGAYPALGVVTFDNRRAAYHHVRLTPGKPVVLLTSPVSSNATSGLDVFNEPRFRVRALVFGAENVTLRVSGAVNGILSFDRLLAPGVSLWSLPAELPFGVHEIVLDGDWAGVCNFTTGNSVPGFKEPGYVGEASIVYQFLFVWLFVFVVVIAVPIEPTGVGEDFDHWVSTRGGESRWLLAVAGGLIVVKRRIFRMPPRFQWALFAAVLWPIALPAAFFKIEGITAILWLWGYAASGTTQSLFVGAKLAVAYIACVIIPIILVASAAVAVQFQSKVVIVDLVVYLTGLAANGYFVYFLMDLCGTLAGLTSPMFLFIPIIMHLLLWRSVVDVLKEQRRRTDAESLI